MKGIIPEPNALCALFHLNSKSISYRIDHLKGQLQYALGVFLITLIPLQLVLGQATVTTDKDDYYPGETVLITGSGWEAGEDVRLHIISDCGCTNVTFITTADVAGNIYCNEFLIEDMHLGATFWLTATGLSSGLTAETTFTDGHSVTSVSPNSGTTAGGTNVTITGMGFVPGSATFTVTFGTSSATSVVRSNSTTITCVTPAHAAGQVNVVVGINGHLATLTNGYTYICVNPAPPSNVMASPSSICPGGSSNLTATSTGNTIHWFTTSSSGTSIGTSASGVNFPVSPVATTTYYAEAVTPTNCKSATRTSVTVTVVAQPAAPGLTKNPNIAEVCAGTILTANATPGTGGTGTSTDQYRHSTALRSCSCIRDSSTSSRSSR